MGAVSNFLASIDPGPAIGSVGNAIDKNVTQPIGKGFAEADKFMTNLTPYGWALPAALVAAYFTAGGSLAAEGATAATEAAAAAGEAAAAEATAAGASAAEATAAANAAADASLASSTGMQAGTGLEALTTSTTLPEVTTALPYTEAYDAANLASQGLSQEAIAQNLTANGLNEFMANDIAQLASQGLNENAINQVLQYSYSAKELAPLGIESLQATLPEGVNVKDVISNANRARQLANLISGGEKPNTQQFAQFQQANQPVQEQFGGLYRMNQNPFAQTQQAASIQNPLARTQDFLAQLAQEGKPTPTLADLVRTA